MQLICSFSRKKHRFLRFCGKLPNGEKLHISCIFCVFELKTHIYLEMICRKYAVSHGKIQLFDKFANSQNCISQTAYFFLHIFLRKKAAYQATYLVDICNDMSLT